MDTLIIFAGPHASDTAVTPDQWVNDWITVKEHGWTISPRQVVLNRAEMDRFLATRDDPAGFLTVGTFWQEWMLDESTGTFLPHMRDEVGESAGNHRTGVVTAEIQLSPPSASDASRDQEADHRLLAGHAMDLDELTPEELKIRINQLIDVVEQLSATVDEQFWAWQMADHARRVAAVVLDHHHDGIMATIQESDHTHPLFVHLVDALRHVLLAALHGEQSPVRLGVKPDDTAMVGRLRVIISSPPTRMVRD